MPVLLLGGRGQEERGILVFRGSVSRSSIPVSGDPVPTPLLPLCCSPPKSWGPERETVRAVASGFSRCLGFTFTFSKMLLRN